MKKFMIGAAAVLALGLGADSARAETRITVTPGRVTVTPPRITGECGVEFVNNTPRMKNTLQVTRPGVQVTHPQFQVQVDPLVSVTRPSISGRIEVVFDSNGGFNINGNLRVTPGSVKLSPEAEALLAKAAKAGKKALAEMQAKTRAALEAARRALEQAKTDAERAAQTLKNEAEARARELKDAFARLKRQVEDRVRDVARQVRDALVNGLNRLPL